MNLSNLMNLMIVTNLIHCAEVTLGVTLLVDVGAVVGLLLSDPQNTPNTLKTYLQLL
jgi:hypothetical protein